MSAKLKPYPKYKDSGIEWLGVVPEKWNISKLKHYILTTKGFAFSASDFGNTGVRVVKASDIKSGTIIPSDVHLPKHYLSTHSQVKLCENDILISTVGSNPNVINSAVGQLALVPSYYIDALLNQNTAILRTMKLNKLFLFYTLLNSAYRDHLDLHAHGTANQSSLNLEDILNYFTTIPSFEEQTTIANYLDQQTAKIDQLIGNYQKLIALSKEKRTALITHCVTKGLDPTVKMKDSGIEWLGEVPERWSLPKFLYLISISSGESIPSDEIKKTGDECSYYPVIGGNGKCGYCDKFNTSLKCFAIGRVGALCGNVHYINYKCWINDNALKISSCQKFYDQYLFYIFSAINLNQYADKNAQPLITGSMIKSKNAPLPSLPEQTTIANYLDKQTAKLDQTVEKAEKAIELLKEKRTALITAVVTGKVDVRDTPTSKLATPLKEGNISMLE